mmetsp:Transcript_8761/g.38971  ORF Transcript_8761/g.38971 Transcript_8761/m.38971 type:complete len:442 (-) Transcript_8761:96-1421(-)|eukprot:CAMPEP_0113954836 /NCGR_PEP_ID=MMETSP0011_2-20120614/872_1 /TAXON_ID=101924 /ORGANISM="Rhodosorus marinus" /LENGTH=441 /DNA_ID=CAMNT_0000964205 /DNA_START=646 /DNA_END=1971 /DNA_ORIENTATION=+ /assembly_acc=CAM_ASM_000156
MGNDTVPNRRWSGYVDSDEQSERIRAEPDGSVQADYHRMYDKCTCPGCKNLPPLSQELNDVLGEQSNWKLALAQLNIAYYGPSLGLSAFTGMWMSVSGNFSWLNVPVQLSWAFWFVTLTVFALTTLAYIGRAYMSVSLLKRDFFCNRLVNFFFSPLIVSTGLAANAPVFLRNDTLSEIVFYCLLAYQLGLSLYVYGDWLFGKNFSLKWVSPTQQMSIIGNFLVASYGASLGETEGPQLMFFVGLLFWIIVVVALFTRLSESFKSMHENPNPTLALFIAPPAAAAVAWLLINVASGSETPHDAVVSFFFFVDFYFYLMVIRLTRSFARQPFAVAFWAVIFPTSTAASSATAVAFGMDNLFWEVIATIFIIAACLAFLYVTVMTVLNLVNGQFVADPGSLGAYALSKQENSNKSSASRTTRSTVSTEVTGGGGGSGQVFVELV